MSETGWRRELSDGASVVVDGRMEGSDSAPVRVVLTMPEYIADAVAHALHDLGEMAERFRMERDWMDEREFAAALFEAAQAAGYHCPDLPQTGQVA